MIAFTYPAPWPMHCSCGFCTSPTQLCQGEVSGDTYARARSAMDDARRQLDRLVGRMRAANEAPGALLLLPEPVRYAWRLSRCLCPSPQPIAQHAPIWRVHGGLSPGQRRALKRRRFVQGLAS